jgi:hypothetical protein
MSASGITHGGTAVGAIGRLDSTPPFVCSGLGGSVDTSEPVKLNDVENSFSIPRKDREIFLSGPRP